MLHRLKSFFRSLTDREHLEAGMDDELRFHIETYEQDLIRSGLSADEAHRQAQREFGSIERMKEECREAKGLFTFDELRRNLRYAFRTLRHSLGTTSFVILTLALCIGANTAIFSVVDAVLFRPLPYPQPEKMGEVIRQIIRDGQLLEQSEVHDGWTWEALKDAESFDIAASGPGGSVNLGLTNSAVVVQQQRVTHNYFQVMGIPLVLGREFNELENQPTGPAVVILSHSLWANIFQKNPGIIGQSILLKGEPYTVIGITARDLHSSTTNLWTSLRPTTAGEGSGKNYSFITRLKPGTTREQALSEIETRGNVILEKHKLPPKVSTRMTIYPFRHMEQAQWKTRLMILWAAAGSVLLIGCLNIAALMLARGQTRHREIGTRIALGGGIGSLFRQLMTESLLLGMIGGAAGLALGYAVIEILNKVVADFGIWQELRLDVSVLLATGGLILLVSFLFGMAPALQAIKVDVREVLLEGTAQSTVGRRSSWPRKIFVLTEVALGLVLLIGAGLLVRTLIHLQTLDPGFDGSNVTTASTSLQDARYQTSQKINQLFRNSLEQIRSLSGVENAAIALHTPYQRWLNSGIVLVGKNNPEGRSVMTTMNYVTTGYFETLRIPLRSGRYISDADQENSAPVMLVNETFVRKLLNNENPLEIYAKNSSGQLIRIIGVVGDIQQSPGLTRFGPLGNEPAVYFPATQFGDKGFKMAHTWFTPHWLIRSSNSLPVVTQQVTGTMQKLDPLLPFQSFQDMTSHRDAPLRSQALNAWLLGSLAFLSLLLAVIGVYGLVANLTAERTREFGIRMSMGATAQNIIWKAVSPGLSLSLIGIAIGTILALGGVKMLRNLVYGIQLMDPFTFVSVCIGFMFISVVACLIPALKVLRLDPVQVLRHN